MEVKKARNALAAVERAKRRNWQDTLRQSRNRDQAAEFLKSQPQSKIKISPRLKPFTTAHFSAFAQHLILDSGAEWKPEPFQLAFLADVFAGVPECWLIVPEGNGKTTLIAGLALYFCEYSAQPVEIPVAASAMEQARILYRQAEGFVLRSPALYEHVYSPIQAVKGKLKLLTPRFQVLPGVRRIDHHRGSHIQIVAADDRTGDGVIFDLAICDELHRHRNLDLYRTWVGKRFKKGGQVIVISTAGEPGGEFELARERIRQELTTTERRPGYLRVASEEVVLHEYAVPEQGDVEDLALVKLANPFSNITVQSLTSKRRSPTMNLAKWRRFTCNLPTRSDSAAIQEAEWHGARVSESIPEGQPIWLGLDVAWKWDTTAAVPLWIRSDGSGLFGAASILVPPRDGSSLDPHLVERTLIGIHQHNPLHTVVMDPSNARQLAMWIEQELHCRVVEWGTSDKIAVQDYERFMEGLRNGKLKHSGDPGLTAHALHAIARVSSDGKARFERPSHSRSEQDLRVIDALDAAAMVYNAAAEQPAPTNFEFAFR